MRRKEERRSHRRINVALPIKLNYAERRIETETKNISISGVFIETKEEIIIGSNLSVTIKIPKLTQSKIDNERLIDCKGTVFRCQPSFLGDEKRKLYGLGIFLNPILGNDRMNFSSNLALLEAQKQLKRAEIDTITALILTEEAKDPYVCGHSERVTVYTMEIVDRLRFSEREQKIIKRAAILHDLGKIGISDFILHKPDKLDEKEWVIVKEHPRKAVEMLEPLSFLTSEKELICHHHERYDGRGYPDGLKAERIPLGARIIAVADTFDAMNSVRPYRKALSKDKIISELKNGSGSQLDPYVVPIFLNLLQRNPKFWER